MGASTPLLPAATRVGAVYLTVADLERSLAFYRHAVGLAILERGASAAALGAGDELLLVLVEEAGARPSPGSTGLYHLALLVPRRVDLARWLAHVARERVSLVGASDHFVSEAVYLEDPDGHGIEVYRDRPRAEWEGRVDRMTTDPLDVAALLGELDDRGTEPFDGLPAGTVVGHVHLQVADTSETVAFYRDVLGFELTVALGATAVFFAAGGYHHHVGANVWRSRGAAPAPAGSAALRHATIVLPDEEERDRAAGRVADAGRDPHVVPEGLLVHDPSGIALVLAAA